MYLGRREDEHTEDLLHELATHLTHKGYAYLTINGRKPHTAVAIEGCHLKIIPEIPPNPNYMMIPDYYGIVLQKN